MHHPVHRCAFVALFHPGTDPGDDRPVGDQPAARDPTLPRPVPAPPPGAGAMQRSYLAARDEARGRFYVTVGTKFVLAGAAAALWLGFSVWLAMPWLRDTARVIGFVPALVIVSLLAFVPGALVAFLVASLLLDRQPPLKVLHPEVPVTVLIAARNESERIGETLEYLAGQDYDGPLRVVLVDNGSTDDTAGLARAGAARSGLDLVVLSESRPGKSHALNHGLDTVTSPLVITVDADTVLHRSAVRLLVARYLSSPPDVVAVAGSVLVRNSRAGMWARIQEWDYFLGIASVKRMQGLYQGTLVAQGAFSLYETDAVRSVGSWPDAIGEDIVLTWKLLRLDRRVFFEPLAVAFTSAPEDLRVFARQRSRWARGMIEGIRTVPPWHQPRRATRILTAIDLVIPFMDTTYIFAWVPGLVLACFGHFWLVGPMTVAVLPLTGLVYAILFRRQWHDVFRPLGLRVRKNWMALVAFLLVYQVLISAVSVRGYAEEVFRLRRRWK